MPNPYYPQSATGLSYISYPAGPNPTGATITASGSINTKGSYTEFVSSSPFTCNYILVTVITASVSGGLYLLDIATGGSGSETVIIPNLLVDRINGATVHQGNGEYAIPINIPSGTRISARCQCSTGSGTLEVGITLIAAGGAVGPSSYTTYGANTGTSGGTNVDPGNTINTKGAYSQLTASSSAVAQVAMLVLSGIGTIGAGANLRWDVDVATGAGGAEVVLIPDLHFGFAPIQDLPIYPRSKTFLLYIPASTRIAIRASCSSNDSVVRNFECAIVVATAPSDVTSGSLARVFTGY